MDKYLLKSCSYLEKQISLLEKYLNLRVLQLKTFKEYQSQNDLNQINFDNLETYFEEEQKIVSKLHFYQKLQLEFKQNSSSDSLLEAYNQLEDKKSALIKELESQSKKLEAIFTSAKEELAEALNKIRNNKILSKGRGFLQESPTFLDIQG